MIFRSKNFRYEATQRRPAVVLCYYILMLRKQDIECMHHLRMLRSTLRRRRAIDVRRVPKVEQSTDAATVAHVKSVNELTDERVVLRLQPHSKGLLFLAAWRYFCFELQMLLLSNAQPLLARYRSVPLTVCGAFSCALNNRRSNFNGPQIA